MKKAIEELSGQDFMYRPLRVKRAVESKWLEKKKWKLEEKYGHKEPVEPSLLRFAEWS